MKKLLVIIIILAIIGGVGYFGYKYLTREVLVEEDDEEETTIVSKEEAIRNLFAGKYDKDLSEISITIDKEEGNYVAGGVAFGEGGPGEGGHFLAVKDDNQWKLVYDGNGSIPCDGVDLYEFPSHMVPECYNEDTNEIIIR